MDTAWLDRVRRTHQEILAEVDRLCAASREDRPLGPALDAFLAFDRACLTPLLLDEERRLGPLLDQYLPAEVACSASLRREHDTVRALVDGLRDVASQVHASTDARADAQSLIDDLVLLLHHHVRREDGVLNPLLRQLEERRR